MEVRIFRTRIRVHPLMLMMIPLAVRLGLKEETAALACGLIIHECAHILAANMLNVSMPEVSLMPFGGSASIGNPYALSPWQLGAVAAAGPFANLMMILTTSALAHWNVLPELWAALCIRANTVLMLFNLLPALPLDGGRMLFALMQKPIGKDRALSIGIWTGRALALCLVICAVCLFIRRGIVNLSYLFAAVFIIASAPAEREALNSSGLHTLIAAMSPLSKPLPVNITAVDGHTSVRRALKAAKP